MDQRAIKIPKYRFLHSSSQIETAKPISGLGVSLQQGIENRSWFTASARYRRMHRTHTAHASPKQVPADLHRWSQFFRPAP